MMNLEKYIFIPVFMLFAHAGLAVELDGTLVWPRAANLGFVVTGAVNKVEARVGAHVNRGDVLVQLVQKPFILDINRARANMESIEPLLFDARIELDQAQELYDRTVLSQIELQRVEARHQGLQAKSRVAEAEHKIANWRRDKARLQAPFEGVVIHNDFIRGQVISDYNKGDLSLQLAPVGVMSVEVSLSAQQRASLSVDDSVQVVIDGEQLAGMVRHPGMRPDEQGRYRSVIEFKYPKDKRYYAGQRAKVILKGASNNSGYSD